MKGTKDFAFVMILLILLPCCKTDTSPPQSKQAPAKEKERLAEPKGGVEPAAREVADRFLKALKTPDSPEGRKTLEETRWRQTLKFPEYLRLAKVSEEMFATDIPGVRGYKQLAKLAIPRKGGRPYVKHYMLIAYEDRKNSAWKVFDFTEATNAGDEAQRACADEALKGSDARTPQGCDMRCGYWLMMAGKVTQAEEMAKKANELYAQNSAPDDEARYYKARADAVLEMISRMTGKRT